VTCELTQTVLHGYLDGELDAARAADFERHLISCPDCVAALEVNENLRSSLQRAGLYERAPAALRQKLREVSLAFFRREHIQSVLTGWRTITQALVVAEEK